MKDQEVILGLLRRIAGRLWFNRALTEVAFGLCVALFTLIAFRLLQPAFGALLADYAEMVVIAALAGLSAHVLWRVARPSTPMQAAAAVDASAGLSDELKSAYWFMTTPEDSPFARLQVARAARRASQLSPRRVAPVAMPDLWALLLVLALALMIAERSVSHAARGWETGFAKDGQLEQSEESLRALLGEAPGDAELERLDQALAVFERADVSAEAAQQAAIEARAAVDAVNLRAVVAREGLARLAEAMQGTPEFEEIARALSEGRADAAAELVERLKDRIDAEESATRQPEAADQVAEGVRSEKAFLDEVEESSRELGNLGARVNEEALNRVLKNIEDAQNMLEAQARVRQVNRRMNDFLAASNQRSSLTASRFGNRANPSNPTPSPETGSTTMQGGTMFRQGAVARGDDDQASNEGNKAGAASGHSAADPLEGIATERLGALLKRETIRLREEVAEDDETGEKSWFYSPTEASRADTAIADVRGRDSYARADAMSPEQIPVRQRGLVKEYFIKLHESEKR